MTWETSDASIATVSQSGEVTAVAPGKAVISVSSVKNPEANAQCEVTVCDHATGIEMASTEEKVNVGSTITLVANTLPLETSDNEVTWSSDDEEIATVDGAGKAARKCDVQNVIPLIQKAFEKLQIFVDVDLTGFRFGPVSHCINCSINASLALDYQSTMQILNLPAPTIVLANPLK